MNEHEVDWRATRFDGSRHEQLRQARNMTVRQRLEALDQLTTLSERLQAMPRQAGSGPPASAASGVREPIAGYRAATPDNEIVLAGCTPTPLSHYLKALGVLRLLSERHPQTRAAWRNENLVLHGPLDRAGLEHFFLHDYQPTPIMAPWNGGSGFYEKDNKVALQAIVESPTPRLAVYRDCLRIAESALTGMDRSASPKGDEKVVLLTRMRALLPDEALGWFDAAVLMAGDAPQYPPLLGTGGNDGRLDFTNNFMQRLTEVLDLATDGPSSESLAWLDTALFGGAAPGLVKKAIGQFSPGQAGGPNATTGFDAEAAINPWDFVLMIEGALSFAAAAARRNADDPFGVLSYPFTVRAVGAGSGSLGESDASGARGELWMPLWNRPASYAEIRALLAEGRVALEKKPARDALDFVRAVHRLGGYRGVSSFQRYGLLMRSGKAYLATPLERVGVLDEPPANVLDDLDHHGWLTQFRRFAQGDNVARRFLALRKRLESAFFELSGREPSPGEAQSVLVLLGDIQSAIASSSKARESVPPVPRLTRRWVELANDGTPAFRIAMALAGLQGVSDIPLPLRAQLFPVQRRHDQWMTPEAGDKVRICTGQQGRLTDTLRALLEHRLWLADKLEMTDREGRRAKPLASPAGATLDDIAAFLQDGRMDDRIAALLPGLSLCDIPRDTEQDGGQGTAPAAFALLKLCLTPESTLRDLRALDNDTHIAVPPGLLAQLAAGNADNRAVRAAWRRLHASGVNPVFKIDALPLLDGAAADGAINGPSAQRVAAALLIPLRYEATRALVRCVLAAAGPEARTA
ncbi:type I-G CRISPR-associated protein Cas8g1/Csx17 [Dyella sp. KRB-257]|uniref:type I-G CRISPR-associated protein Cas8g1/Csx17 n=1 Tax=Dyella sp. KRB-257 TaxID=3400915 RepID=UPI003C0F8017